MQTMPRLNIEYTQLCIRKWAQFWEIVHSWQTTIEIIGGASCDLEEKSRQI